ncbi:MAG: signal peptidase II [Ruminococcus sp.]|nr:signal peptidase II [Candidatus Copronaster equi]
MSVLVSLLSITLLTVVDQIIKLIVQNNLQPIGSAPFLDGVVGWHYLRNTGAAFGMLSDSTIILSVFTALVLIVAIFLIVSKKITNKFYLFCTVLMVSGGLGNLIDRIFRHYVVDYIEVQFMNFAIFNFADILVTVGAFALIIYLIVDIFRERKNGEKSE